MSTRVPEAFTFVEEDPELAQMKPRDAWEALVARLEPLADDELLVRCAFGHSWKAQRVVVNDPQTNKPVASIAPDLCTAKSCQIPAPVLTMGRKSIDTIRRLASLPDGHRLGRCASGHEWDADDEAHSKLRVAGGRPKCPTCDDAPAEVCFVSSPLFAGGHT